MNWQSGRLVLAVAVGRQGTEIPCECEDHVIFEASTPQLFSLTNLRIDNGVRNVLHKSRERERERERERPLEAAAGFGEEEEGASRHAHGQRWLL